MLKKMALGIGVASALVAFTGGVTAAQDISTDGDWHLVLFDAARSQKAEVPSPSNVKMDISCVDGQWQQRPWMWNLEGGSVESRGVLKAVGQRDGAIVLEVTWQDTAYAIEVRRSGNTLTGLYTSKSLEGQAAAPEGRVVGEVYPFEDRSFDEVKPGEHPRLLLRKHDLPRVRAFARTEVGKALIERLREETASKDKRDNPSLACALLYVVAGDLDMGERAANSVRSGRFDAWTFDLVYDLLSPEERARRSSSGQAHTDRNRQERHTLEQLDQQQDHRAADQRAGGVEGAGARRCRDDHRHAEALGAVGMESGIR